MATQKKRQATGSKRTAAAPADYVDVAIAYARDVVKNKGGIHGTLIQLAAARFLSDLKGAKLKGAQFKFDRWHANDACDFIEKLPHVEGVWDKPEIVLHASHVFFIVQLFGFRLPDGRRRYTSALFAVARKNAKSTLAAAILLYCQCCEDEPGAQVISAATTGSQARIIWGVAKRMVEKTPDLREAFGLSAWANSISRMEAGASFKPINSKASTQDGLNPSHVGIDEIHAHTTADLVNVLASAQGARRNPLWLYTTTEGYISSGPWSEMRHFARQVLEGVVEAEHFLVVWYAVDKDDDDFDEKAWRKANPLSDVNPHLLSAIRKEAIEARAMPSKLAEFRIKRLNRQSAAEDSLIRIAEWDACDGKVDLDWLAQYPCTAAFDLSATSDLTSWRLVWRVDGKWYTWGRRWVTADAAAHRTARGMALFTGWIEAGHIESIPGNVIDYAVIEAAIKEDCARFNPRVIAFDDWNARDICNRLIEADLPMVKFIQGPRSYHPAMQAMEFAYLGNNLAHGGDPVLRWCAANLIARRDANMNMAPDKRKSPDKIDDMVALVMAMGVALDPDDEGAIDDFLRNPVIG